MTEISPQQTPKERPLRPRLVAGVVLAVVFGVFFFVAWMIARMALDYPHATLWIRVPLFFLSALMLTPPIYLAAAVLRRKWKTGRFLLPRDEALAQRAAVGSKMGAGKPFRPQAIYWSAKAFPLAVCCAVAVMCVAGAMQFGAEPGFRALRILLLVLAGVCLLAPAWVLFRAIRRKRKTGYYLPSQEELQKARAKCGMPKPLWQRILLAILFLGNAMNFTDTVIFGHHRSSIPQLGRWAIAALVWFCAIQWTWDIFRPPPRVIPSPPEISPPSDPAPQI